MIAVRISQHIIRRTCGIQLVWISNRRVPLEIHQVVRDRCGVRYGVLSVYSNGRAALNKGKARSDSLDKWVRLYLNAEDATPPALVEAPLIEALVPLQTPLESPGYPNARAKPDYANSARLISACDTRIACGLFARS